LNRILGGVSEYSVAADSARRHRKIMNFWSRLSLRSLECAT
jgi:hypothetical protein